MAHRHAATGEHEGNDGQAVPVTEERRAWVRAEMVRADLVNARWRTQSTPTARTGRYLQWERHRPGSPPERAVPARRRTGPRCAPRRRAPPAWRAACRASSSAPDGGAVTNA